VACFTTLSCGCARSGPAMKSSSPHRGKRRRADGHRGLGGGRTGKAEASSPRLRSHSSTDTPCTSAGLSTRSRTLGRSPGTVPGKCLQATD
jgi:hypothetical protein